PISFTRSTKAASWWSRPTGRPPTRRFPSRDLFLGSTEKATSSSSPAPRVPISSRPVVTRSPGGSPVSSSPRSWRSSLCSSRGGLNAVMLFIAFAAIPAGIYLASYVRWFGGPTIPYGWSLVELTQQMYWYHSGLTAPHPAGSPWWSWPLVLKPVYWYFGASTGGDNAYIYDTGNVALFWAGIVAFGWCAIAAVRSRSLPLAIVVFAGLV